MKNKQPVGQFSQELDYRFSFWGPLLVETKIDQEFLDILLEKGKESRDKNLDHRKNLAGVLRHEYYYDNPGEWYFSRMHPYISAYLEAIEKYKGSTQYSNTPNPTDITKWELIKLWINFQQAKEYNPPHDHGGDLSFVIYLQVPDEIKEENKKAWGERRNEGPGMISFDYGLMMPFSISRHSRLPSAGDLFIFPAWLPHHVHSFDSDVERISVSGNIDFRHD